jgi:hypothetical protein
MALSYHQIEYDLNLLSNSIGKTQQVKMNHLIAQKNFDTFPEYDYGPIEMKIIDNIVTESTMPHPMIKTLFETPENMPILDQAVAPDDDIRVKVYIDSLGVRIWLDPDESKFTGLCIECLENEQVPNKDVSTIELAIDNAIDTLMNAAQKLEEWKKQYGLLKIAASQVVKYSQ